MSALEAEGLYRFYRSETDEVVALRDVALQLSPGAVLAVTGPSGSGKSTLVRVLAGLEDPDGGRVLVRGERLSHAPERVKSAIRGRSIGLVLQTDNLVEHLSVRSNVALAAALSGQPVDVDGALTAAGIAHRATSRPSELSGGEGARAAMAIAIANARDVLLLDEPTAEVDEACEDLLLRAVRECARAGTACLIVTHSDRVAAASDRVMVLSDGRLAAA